MNAYKIERGIPIPPKGGERTGLTATLRALDVGDSFLIANEKERLRALHFASRAGVKIATRKVEGGIRVWRTK